MWQIKTKKIIFRMVKKWKTCSVFMLLFFCSCCCCHYYIINTHVTLSLSSFSVVSFTEVCQQIRLYSIFLCLSSVISYVYNFFIDPIIDIVMLLKGLICRHLEYHGGGFGEGWLGRSKNYIMNKWREFKHEMGRQWI